MTAEGILLVDKPQGISSFKVVAILRKKFQVKRIGHGGTLDPLATGVMILFVGRKYTKMANQFLFEEKEYESRFYLGFATDTYDRMGTLTKTSDKKPTLEEIQEALVHFQGECVQLTPPYSARKVQGKRMYQLARQGIEVERKPSIVHMHITLLSYEYPYLRLKIVCSKGTYIRSLAHDLGEKLGSYAHVDELRRTRSGSFKISECITSEQLLDRGCSLFEFLKHETIPSI